MIADWKDVKKILPEKRIRVIVCDSIGYMQTAFYGRQSSILGDKKECWRHCGIWQGEDEKEMDEKDAVMWDNFPESPFPKKNLFP